MVIRSNSAIHAPKKQKPHEDLTKVPCGYESPKKESGGFFCGLAMELLFGETLGFQALIYMWLGYMAGYFYRIFYDDDIKTPLMLVCGADLIYGLYQYVFSFLLRGRIHFFYYLGRVIIPEMLYTLMMTILIYWILYRINHLLNKSDKRRIDSLV